MANQVQVELVGLKTLWGTRTKFRDLLAQVAQVYGQFLRDRFYGKGQAEWTPLKPATIKRKGHATILVDTGDLAASVATVIEKTPEGVIIRTPNRKHRGTNLTHAELAQVHDEGQGNVPVRPIYVDPDPATTGIVTGKQIGRAHV